MPTDVCGTTTFPILRGTLNFADEPTAVNFESPMANAALSRARNPIAKFCTPFLTSLHFHIVYMLYILN